ncbi:TIGR02444 family protein [Microbulbifer pacificus]|uniref:TIGR02444 family protein n=1 Tax=Microbulbifer pacificus TaxID=407164 RepID=A0AAU0MVN1_9GAMM|nr:TIGR02444 family protein [Microbulbifer pacificus]WOX04092.1 TIGR02444 family protein [Microbulbifer pacificus]
MTETAPPSPPLSPLQNPLWDFSLEFYRQPQVADFLLECQDTRGADVCLLLWASYTSACGRQLSDESWRVADRGLAPRRRMINSVRNLRRMLARVNKGGWLYEWCKRSELRMEQRQLAALWKLNGEAWPETRSPLELAGQQYGLLQKEQARWAGLIDAYSTGIGVARGASPLDAVTGNTPGTAPDNC